MKKDWTPVELKDIATWAAKQGGSVSHASNLYLKAEARLKAELIKVAELTERWDSVLSEGKKQHEGSTDKN